MNIHTVEENMYHLSEIAWWNWFLFALIIAVCVGFGFWCWRDFNIGKQKVQPSDIDAIMMTNFNRIDSSGDISLV